MDEHLYWVWLTSIPKLSVKDQLRLIEYFGDPESVFSAKDVQDAGISKSAAELFKKRESLMAPIQEEIYTAVKDICELRGYSLVLDRASDAGIIFGSPKIDISNDVLQKLGYSVN